MPNLLEGLLQGTGQASGGSDNAFSLQDLLESQLGGYYKGADKAMKEMGEQQVTEALQKGVPAIEVMKGLIKMVSPKGAFDPGGVEQGQQGEISGIRQPGWVSRIGQAGLQAQGIDAQSLPMEQLQQLLQSSQIQGQQTQTQRNQNFTPDQLGTLINDYNEKLPKGYNAALSAEGRITASKTGQTLAEEKFERLLQEKEEAKAMEGDLVKQSATDTIDTISKIEENMNLFGFTGSIPPIPGTPKYVWSTYVNKLTSSKIIDLIMQMKKASKTGATGFGQLSEKEGQILKESATALRKSLPSKEAQRILDRMKPLLEKIVSGQQTEQQQGGIKTFNIGGKRYDIPVDKVEAFKKAKGIQ